MRYWQLRIWVGLGLIVLPAGAAMAVATPATPVEISRLVLQLRGSDMAQARAALDELLAAGEPAKKQALSTLAGLGTRRRGLRDNARQRLIAMTKLLCDPARRKMVTEALDVHAKAAAEVLRFAFDDKEYPVPAKAHTGWSPGRDYQKGQIPLEGRVEVAIGRFNQAETKLLRLLGYSLPLKRPGGGGFGKAYLMDKLSDPGQPLRVLTYNIADSGLAWAKVGASLAERVKALKAAEEAFEKTAEMARQAGVPTEDITPPPDSTSSARTQQAGEIPALVLAAGALFAGEYAEATRLRPSDEADGRMFDLLVRRHMLVCSAKRRGDWTRPEQEAVYLLNLYRLSLNLCPLMINPKIYAAAAEHSQWQNQNNQMSHARPEKDKSSFSLRLRVQGYRWGSSENIAGGTPKGAIWSWRADAGHHRNLISKRHRACAIAQVGRFVTYNTGTKIEIEGLGELIR